MSVRIDTFKTDSFEMEYCCFGTGERIAVILPGLSVKSVMRSANGIAAAYKSWGERYTVYVFDRRRDCPEGYTAADMADDTAEALYALGIGGAYIFGASQGGMIAQCIALSRPDLVRGLALCSTVGAVTEENGRVVQRWVELASCGDIDSLNRSIAESIYSDGFFAKYGAAITELMSGPTDEELRRFVVLAEGCRGFDLLDRLDGIKCPVLVTGSRKDRVFDSEDIALLAEKARARLYLYDGFGHAVYDEAPDHVGRILDFFDEI